MDDRLEMDKWSWVAARRRSMGFVQGGLVGGGRSVRCRTCRGSRRVGAVSWRVRDAAPAVMCLKMQQEEDVAVEAVKGVRIDDSDVDHPGDAAVFPERWRVVLMTFFSFVICNMDRINVSVAILPMKDEFGWSQSTVGVVQSAFFWGYILTQIPGGYLADKYGGKNVLSFGVVMWSIMTFVTPIAATVSLPVLLVARALLGVGEGVAMPAMNGLISKWVPSSERSRSLSLIYSGMYMGSTVGLLSCPALIHMFGWPSVFYVFGGLGIGWYTVWELGFVSSPEESKRISASEKDYILNSKAAESSKTGPKPGEVPWERLLSSPATWAINVSHFCCTWGYFVFLTWLPTYFNQEFGFDIKSSALVSVLPWLSMFLAANGGGYIADQLYQRGVSLTRVRKIMQTIGFVGPATFLALTSQTDSPALGVLFMTLALGFGSFSQSGVYANHQDIGPDYAGVLLGISNTIASLPGIIGVALTGFILDYTGNWDAVFGIAIGFYVLGTVVYNTFGTGERQF